MARPKSVTIKLTPKQRAELQRLTGENHTEVMFEAAKAYRSGAIQSKATLAQKTAPVAKTRAAMKVAPVAKTRSAMKVAPVAKTRSAMKVAPVAKTRSAMTVAPVAKTRSAMKVAPSAKLMKDKGIRNLAGSSFSLSLQFFTKGAKINTMGVLFRMAEMAPMGARIEK